MAKVRKRQWVTPSGEQREAWILAYPVITHTHNM